jgi:hypothetical protein
MYVLRAVIDASMTILFLKMSFHFYKAKRLAMDEQLRPWSWKHTLVSAKLSIIPS